MVSPIGILVQESPAACHGGNPGRVKCRKFAERNHLAVSVKTRSLWYSCFVFREMS